MRAPQLARRLIPLAMALTLGAACSAPTPPPPLSQSGSAGATGGDVDRGKQLFAARACIACHVAPGVAGASGSIGPNLTGFAARPQIAEVVPNTRENLRQWLRDPAALKPGTQMPSLQLNDQEADDLSAFLETLR